MKSIVTITMNPAIDKSSSVDHVVAEHKLYCKEPLFEPGGGGINVSRAIKKLGGESVAVYPCGGATGQHLKLLLDHEEGRPEVAVLPLKSSTPAPAPVPP